MYPILFSIGGFNIPTYTLLLDLGILLALALTYFEGRRLLHNGQLALDLGLWTVIGGIVGGRLGFVLTRWVEFGEDWLRTLRVWEGGLAFHGAFFGGAMVVLLYARIQSHRGEQATLWELCDVLTPGLALGIFFGWAACLMAGCAYGIMGEGFAFAFLPDLYGVGASRFATQAIGIGFSLLLFLVAWLLRTRWPFQGAAFWTFVLLYFSGHFFLELTRGDEMPYLGPWRLAQVVDMAMVAIAAIVLITLWWRSQTTREEPQETANLAPHSR